MEVLSRAFHNLPTENVVSFIAKNVVYPPLTGAGNPASSTNIKNLAAFEEFSPDGSIGVFVYDDATNDWLLTRNKLSSGVKIVIGLKLNGSVNLTGIIDWDNCTSVKELGEVGRNNECQFGIYPIQRGGRGAGDHVWFKVYDSSVGDQNREYIKLSYTIKAGDADKDVVDGLIADYKAQAEVVGAHNLFATVSDGSSDNNIKFVANSNTALFYKGQINGNDEVNAIKSETLEGAGVFITTETQIRQKHKNSGYELKKTHKYNILMDGMTAENHCFSNDWQKPQNYVIEHCIYNLTRMVFNQVELSVTGTWRFSKGTSYVNVYTPTGSAWGAPTPFPHEIETVLSK